MGTREWLIHQVEADHILSFQEILGNSLPSVQIVVLQPLAIASRGILPEIIQRPMQARADEVAIAPQVAPVEGQAVVQHRPVRGAIAPFSGVQVLVHVQENIDLVPLSQLNLLGNPRQIRFIDLARCRFDFVPINTEADQIDAMGRQLFIKRVPAGGDEIMVSFFIHQVDAVENDLLTPFINEAITLYAHFIHYVIPPIK